jgi:hypothetical protein
VLIVLGVIAGGAIFMGAMKIIKSTEPYKTAVAAAINCRRSKARHPHRTGFMPQGNVNSNTSNGETRETADLTIPLKGPKASGSVHYAATKNGSTWEVSDFTVTIDGTGEKISLAP